MDANGYVAGYRQPHCEVHFITLEEGDSYKDVQLLVLEKGRKIAPADIHRTVPIKTIHIADRTYLVTAEYI